MTLALTRLTRWSLTEILSLEYQDAVWWLDGAIELEKEIKQRESAGG